MSNVIDRKVVEMQFDNSQFEKNVSGSIKTLDKLKDSLKFEGIDKSFDSIESRTKKLDFSEMSYSLSKVGDKFSALEQIAIGSLRRIGERAVDVGLKFAKSLSVDNYLAGWSKYEDKTRSVGTLIAQGFDISVVNEQLDRLNWYTDETSYSFTNMVAEIAKFTATGKGLEESVDALMGIANWAAVSGQNASTASRAMYQLSQAMGSGVMRKEDYKSIQNVSMDTAEFRQKALDAGVALGTLKKNADGTYQSIVKGAKSSKFNISQFADHLTQDAWFTSDVMMSVYRDYGNAIDQIYEYSEKNGVTASQAIEELGDQLDAFGIKAFKAAQEARSWQDTVDSVKEAVASGFMQTYEILFGQYDDAVDLWTDLANRFYDLFAQPINDLNDELRTGLQEHSTYVSRYLSEEYGVAGKSIEAASEAIKKFGVGSKEATRALNELTHGNTRLNSLISNYIQLFKLGEDGSKVFRATSEGIIEYTSKMTGASKENLTALKEIGDQYGYTSSQYRKEMATVFGEGKKDVFETATAMLAVTNGITLLQEKDIDAYLENTLKMTSGQVKELHKLADEYGNNSKEVDEYLDSLDNLKGFGNSNDLKNLRKSIVGLLNAGDTSWNTGDIVSYISNLTGASKENIKILTDLISTKKELESAELNDADAIRKNAEARKKNSEEISKFVDEISGGDEALKTEILDLINLNRSLDEMSGYRNILQSFNNIWDYLAKILGAVKEAFSDVFPPLTADRIYDFTERIRDFTSRLDISEESLDRIKRTFSGFFSVIKLVGQAVKPVLLPLKALLSVIFNGSERIAGSAAGLGDWLTKLAESGKVAKASSAVFSRLAGIVKVIASGLKNILSIRSIIDTFKSSGGGVSGVLSVILEKIKSVVFFFTDFAAEILGFDPTRFKTRVTDTFNSIKKAIDNVLSRIDFKKFADRISSAFNRVKEIITGIFSKKDNTSSESSGTVKAFSKLAEFAERIGAVFERVWESITVFFNGIKNVFTKFKEAFMQSKIGQILSDIWKKIKEIASSIGTFLVDGLKKLGEKFSELDVKDVIAFFSKLATLVMAVSGALIGLDIKNTIKDVNQGIKGIPGAIKNVFNQISNLINGLSDVVKSFKKKAEVSVLKDIAFSILLIAASLVALSLVPLDKLAAASGALINITGAMIGMVGALKGLGKDGSLAKKAENAFNSKILLKIAEAILVVAISLRLLKGMKPAEIAAATGAVIAILGSMLGVILVLGKAKIDSNAVTAASNSLLSFSISLRVIVMSVSALAKLYPEKLVPAVVAVETLMATMILTASILGQLKDPERVKKSSSGLLVFAITLRVIVSSVKSLAKLNPGRLLNAMTATVTLITAMTLVAKSLSSIENPGKIVKSAAGLIILATALGIIVLSVKLLSTIGVSSLVSSVAAITVILAELVTASVILSKFSSGKSVAGASSIVVMAMALAMLAPVVKYLGSMEWGEILKGVVAIAAILGVMVGAGYVFKAIYKYLLLGAAAVALLGAGVTLMGVGLVIGAAGIAAFGAGIVSFAAAISGSSAIIISAIKTILTGVIEMVPLLAQKLAEGFMNILNVISNNEETMKDAFLAILRALLGSVTEGVPEIVDTVFNLIISVIAKLVEKTPELVTKLFDFLTTLIDGLASNLPRLIKSAANLVKAFIEGLIAAMAEFSIDNIDDLQAAAVNLLGVMGILAAISVIFPLAFAGVLALGTIAVELLAVLTALGGISKIPGVSDLISAGGGLLGQIGIALGKFVGGFLGAVTEGVASVLPNIAGSLSEFAMGIVPFITIMKMVDNSVLDGAISMAGAILAITAADVISQVAEFFGASASFESLGDKFEAFGLAMARFSEATAGLNVESFSVVAEAASHLVGLAQSLPNTEGLWGWISGKEDIAGFGDKLGALASGMVTFAKESAKIPANAQQAMINCANALGPVVDIANNLPNTEGAWGWLSGKEDIGGFGDKLGSLASGMATFAKKASKITEEDIKAMTALIPACKSLVEIAGLLPNTEGAWGWLSGKEDIGGFGDKLGSLASGMATFAKKASGITPEDIKAIATLIPACKSLVEIAGILPNSEGAWGWLSGKQNLGDFANNLSAFGSGVAALAGKIKGISAGQTAVISNIVASSKSLAELSASNPDASKLKDFAKSLPGLATDITSFASTLGNSARGKGVTTAVSNVNKISDMIKKLPSGGSMTSFASGITSLATTGVNGFVSAFSDSYSRVTSAVRGFMTAAKNTANGFRSSFNTIGSNVIQSFIDGMNGKKSAVYTAAYNIGKKAVEGLKDGVNAHPSSNGASKAGGYFGDGFVEAVEDFTDASYNAGNEVGKSAMEGLATAISDSSLGGMDGLDNTVTIRPVIDLSEIQNGIAEADGMLGTLSSYSIGGSMKLGKSTLDSMSGNHDDNTTIDKLVKTVEELGDKLGDKLDRPNQTNNFNFNGLTNDELIREVKKSLTNDIIKEGRKWA